MTSPPAGPLRHTLETPNVFPGQLLTAEQLNHNVATERERRWFHNRALHGTGISSGLTVTGRPGDVELTVEPGHAIDPDGRDLILTTPVSIQVPPHPGLANGTQPVTYLLVCRWDDQPAGTTATGPCAASGVVAWSEEPRVELLADTSTDGSGVPLATVDVATCVIVAIDLGRRRVLGERKLPYVDGGVATPGPLEWELVRSSETGPRYGLRATVDTSVAGFASVPDYQVRVSGRRWGVVEAEDEVPFVLWTPDANVVGQTSRSVTFEILIPSVQLATLDAAGIGGSGLVPLETFLTDQGLDNDEFRILVADQLAWGVTWIGVEGSL